jgi:hypothetical protein
MLTLGMVQNPHDAERKVLHCAEHAHQRLPELGKAHHAAKTAAREAT